LLDLDCLYEKELRDGSLVSLDVMNFQRTCEVSHGTWDTLSVLLRVSGLSPFLIVNLFDPCSSSLRWSHFIELSSGHFVQYDIKCVYSSSIVCASAPFTFGRRIVVGPFWSPCGAQTGESRELLPRDQTVIKRST
jgi:hypothetical protein